MAKTKRDKEKIDGDIIQHLMLTDNEQTARSIAKAIGYSKAKDINSRLTTLYNKSVITKVKCGNQIFWSIEQDISEASVNYKSPATKDKQQQQLNITVANDERVGSLNNKLQGGYNDLVHIMNQLREEIVSLRKDVECLKVRKGISRIVQSIPSYTSSPDKSTSKEHGTENIECQNDNSWSPDMDITQASPYVGKIPTASNDNRPNISVTDADTSKSKWASQNKFAKLAYTNNWCNDQCQGECGTDSNVRHETSTNSISSSRIFYNNKPGKPALSKSTHSAQLDTSMHHSRQVTHQDTIPVVPGPQLYSKVHENVVSIVTDSMSNKIRARDFNDCLPPGNRAIFKKFPGAIATEIHDYSATTIRRDSPKGLAVIAGANDISYGSKYGRQPDVYEIARNIIGIGVEARKKGVRNIFISSIITRRGLHVELIRREVNKILYQMCIEHSFYYINNDNIGVEHLWDDGLHLNDLGGAIFQSNLLRCFDAKLYIY